MVMPRSGAFLIGTVVLCVSGCGDSHEAVTRDLLSAQTQLGTILAEVKDEDSAHAAAVRVEELADKMESLKKRSDALGPAPEVIQESLRNKYEEEFRIASESITQSLSRLEPQHAIPLKAALTRVFSSAGN